MRHDPTGTEVPPASSLGRVHFIGIGGAGMSGIARILLARGVPVSGSDAKDSRALAALRALGAPGARRPRRRAPGPGGDTVVVSTAVRESNPELAAARAAGLLVLHRSQALAAVMAGRRAVAVAGTHGKTTTTSMLTVALQHCGADPSFAIGGELTEGGANAHDGTGDVFVAEADESDGSFLLYRPDGRRSSPTSSRTTWTTTAPPEAVAAAFDAFCDRVAPGGAAGRLRRRPRARPRLAAGPRRGWPPTGSGWSPTARRPTPTSGSTRSTSPAPAAGSPSSRVRRRARPGRSGAGSAAGAGPAQRPERGRRLDRRGRRSAAGARRSPAGLAGVRRGPAPVRVRGRPPGSGCSTTTPTTRPRWPPCCAPPGRWPAGGRVIAVFQPHLYSRTRIFAAEFGAALGLADEVVVMDVYAAREDPEPGVTGALVAGHVPLPGRPGRLRAVLVAGRRRGAGAGPARRPGADHRGRRRDDAGAEILALLGEAEAG